MEGGRLLTVGRQSPVSLAAPGLPKSPALPAHATVEVAQLAPTFWSSVGPPRYIEAPLGSGKFGPPS